MGKKVLVTGANGFIGAHLSCKLVQEENEVFAICRKTTSNNELFNLYVREGKIKVFLGDIQNFDYTILPQFDTVCHIAGKVSVYGKMSEFIKINFDATNRLLDFCAERNVETFIYFSSTAVYGYDGYTGLKEDAPKKPFKNPYSITKLKTENLVKAFCKNNNMDFLIIRPGNVYGEYDYTSSHQIYTRVKNGKMYICAHGKYKSCFVYVKNLVDFVSFALSNKDFHNQDYNVTDGQNETLYEYLSLVAKTFGVKPKFTNVPSWIAKIIASIVEVCYYAFHIKKAPIITKFSVWQNCANYNFSIEKIKSTGFEAKYDARTAVLNTCNWINSLEEGVDNGYKK